MVPLLLCLWLGYNTYPIWRDYLTGPPVEFLKNQDIAFSLYPGGYQSAAIFTNDDLCGSTPPAAVERLRDYLKRAKVKGTFFVIPFHRGDSKLEAGSPAAHLIRKLEEDGHEIAQHGLRHFCRKNEGRGVKMGAEMLYLTEAETVARLREGFLILKGLGISPVGHRSPCFSGTETTFRVLDDLGFIYGSDLGLPPTTPRTLLTRSFGGRIIYPYHPDGLRLLEITCQTDPTVHWEKAVTIFDRFHRRQGVFVYLTHLPQISADQNLLRLEKFINYLKSHNTWLCTLEELSKWWLAREKLRVATEIKGDTLIVTCDNPTAYQLKDIEIAFQKTDSPTKRYRVLDRRNGLLAEGMIPSSRYVRTNIPAGLPARDL